MSIPLSELLLREIDEVPDVEILSDEIIVNFQIVPGLRDNSSLVWAFEEQQLYYKKSVNKNGIQSCVCNVPTCNARMFIKPDGSGYKKTGQRAHKRHQAGYTEYKMMYCFNKMKEKAKNAPVCMQPFDIYTEVVKE